MRLSFLSRLKTGHEPASERGLAARAGRIDDRLYIRSPIGYSIIVSWQDALGQKRNTEARGMNMSSAGALVRSEEPIPAGTLLYIESKQLRLMANAIVRHCTEQKSRFLIGMEFRGSLMRSY
jgi:hypothetical protein